MLVEYSSNNSGGKWWLTDDNWRALEATGWAVAWHKDEPKEQRFTPGDRELGALAHDASKQFETPGEAMRDFEKATGANVMDDGCDCCGPPHSFSWGEGKQSEWASGGDCGAYLFPDVSVEPMTLRQTLEKLSNGAG